MILFMNKSDFSVIEKKKILKFFHVAIYNIHFLLFIALALASFECEAPEKSFEKEKHKQLK